MLSQTFTVHISHLSFSHTILNVVLIRGLKLVFNPFLLRDHEIDSKLWTPARDHLLFPDMKVQRKVFNYKLFDKGKDTINLDKSFEDLPTKETLVPNWVAEQSVSIKDGDVVKDLEKISCKKDIRFSSALVKFDRDRKYLKVKNMPVLNHSLPSPAKRLPLKVANLCNSRLDEAKSLQKKMVSGRIDKTGFGKPLVKKIQTSLDFDNAEMKNRYFMCIVICLCFSGIN